MIALNFYHPQHGYVTLMSAEPFDESQRYNPASVRAYRASLTEQDGYGMRSGLPILESKVRLLESAIPQVELRFEIGSVTITTFAYAQGAMQRIDGKLPGNFWRWNGQVCLQRCAYTQLTEGGPVTMPPLRMRVFAQDGLLIIHNPELPAAVAIAGLDVTEIDKYEQEVEHYPLALGAEMGGALHTYGIGLSIEEAIANARWLLDNARLDDAAAQWQTLLSRVLDDPLVRRGVFYAKLCAVPVGEGVCLLTDHMLLPLSWNRDAYYAARALLSVGEREIVRRHLIWTFEQAERGERGWARCYMANGKVKDGAFQLDQQLFPLLELAEYLYVTGDQEARVRLLPHVEKVLAGLSDRYLPDNGGLMLFPTDETPADDPIALPYHFSSHVLLWHTLNRLARVCVENTWTARLAELRETIQRVFAAEHEGWRIYAYATDGKGGYHFYHDANDFPLALAAAWGFVSADDVVWRATVDFAFSEANAGGFYDGHLGSVHSRAAWALGDVQELIIARALGDTRRAERARASLRRAAQVDGALPEAYNAVDGSVFSRHWFVWTNAALACVELGAFD
jgi:hypothetical protein